MGQRRRPTDTGADYNTFGRDPNGLIAYLCALFFGPLYVPLAPPTQFVGRALPPRYGPPARYQLACLPTGFIPQSPPNYLDSFPELASMNDEYFLVPPAQFDPHMFYVLGCVRRVCRHRRGEHLITNNSVGITSDYGTVTHLPSCNAANLDSDFDDDTDVGLSDAEDLIEGQEK